MKAVLFVRLKWGPEATITAQLAELYEEGWRVVAHAILSDEITFVLERDVATRP